jgi:6-phosphogluconolactonase
MSDGSTHVRTTATSRRNVLRLSGAAAISAAAGTLAFRGATADAAAAPFQRFYIGAYGGPGGKNIAKGRIDPATGALTVDIWTAAVTNASWLDLAPDGKTLYAVSELTPGGTVNALRISSGGDPSLLNTQATGSGSGPTHVAVHPSGKFLFASLYGSGEVVTHRIAADGTVSAPTDTRQQGGNAHQVVVDPTGQYVLAVNLGVNTVFAYRLDATTGKLADSSRLTLASGSGPRHLAFHPNGGYAYIANENKSSVTVCKWASGVLTKLKVINLSFGVTNYPGEILVSADGRFVYVSNRGHNSISAFAVVNGGASLTLLSSPSCGGDWPRNLAIDATGKWIYAVNQNSGDITWFPIDATTGIPGAAAGRIAVAGAAQLRFA